MRRTNIYLTDEQCVQLNQRAAAVGASRARLIREILDRALHGERDRLSSDVAAIEDSFGVLVGEVSDLDRADGVRDAHLARVTAHSPTSG